MKNRSLRAKDSLDDEGDDDVAVFPSSATPRLSQPRAASRRALRPPDVENSVCAMRTYMACIICIHITNNSIIVLTGERWVVDDMKA